MQKITSKIEFNGLEYSLETGRFAKFANGAVMVRCGDSMVLVTVVASEESKPETDFLPLQVEYREKTASAGKFPGGFIKREGRPSDKEILSARLIDRPVRPLLPKTWNYETQIIATVFSADPDVNPDTLAAVGTSAALMISNIPFAGPISEVRVGKIDDDFVINPSFELLKKSQIDITVAGTDSSIVMVEGECKEISEEDFLGALEFAHEKIIELNGLQKKFLEQVAQPKREYPVNILPSEFIENIKNCISSELNEYIHTITNKSERTELRNKLQEKALDSVKTAFAEQEGYKEFNFEKNTSEAIHDLEKDAMRMMIIEESRRLDGRGLTDIRPITCEIGLLPRTHGSALFTRGETQSLTTVTLGTKRDEQQIDGLQPTYTNNFILHYNFPPFCTGETGRIGGVGRREIGHGNLAERALKIMAPEPGEFPYTIRVVSDILESNGSSSMATVCAGSLALFDAGVPMKKPVAGIAMGLIKEDDRVAVLSDILGDEDHLGDMDFKVTGTADGITACQMDIKIEGISIEIMKKALHQAREGRMHILSIMNELIEEPNEELSKHAPRYSVINIPVESIGAVIGPGGEVIRSIVAETNTDINIDDDGKILIASVSKEGADHALDLIRAIIRKPCEGDIYTGKVKEVREDLGAFVEFLPKKQGLLHISQIAHERINKVSDVLKVGDQVEVKLLEVSNDGKFRLSRKALLPAPERQPGNEIQDENRPPRQPRYSDRDDRDRRPGYGDRDRRPDSRDSRDSRDRRPRR
jgi:polyribonucleotide nucleotidyltransferase